MTSLPRTTWEGEEVRFVDALRTWDPLQLQPEAPAYPLYVGLGRLANFFIHDPFVALLFVSAALSVAGAALTALAASALVGNAWAGAAATLILWLSPTLLVFGPLPNPEAAAMALLAAAVLALIYERPVLFGIAAAAVVGIQPETLPAVLVLVLGGCFVLRRRLAVVAAFAISLAIAFVPVVEAIGIRHLARYASGNFESLQIASHASGLNARDAVLRFAAHPWGAKYLAFPLLIAAIIGLVIMVRRSRLAVILALFALVHLVFCVAYADRGDGVQPAIPAMMVIAVFAAAAMARWPAIAFAAALVYGAAAYAYAAPILSARRSSPSPPSAAATYAKTALPRNAVLLCDAGLEGYARHCGLSWASIAGADPLAAPLAVPCFVLADGGSHRKGSQTFAWPDSDAYGKITTERYRVVSVTPFPARERFRAVSGVYGVQRTAGGEEWRWLARVAVIEVLPQSKEIAIGLAFPADAPIARNVVTIAAGGTPQTITISRGEEIAVVIPLSGSRVEVRCADTFTPPDGRELAVQLRGVEQRP